MLNLAKITKSVINAVSPYLNVTLKIFNGQTNEFGKIVSKYIFLDTQANIQSTNKKELKDINGINVSDTFLTFYFVKADLSTVDRVLEKGVDFIIYKNVSYKIVKVLENFNTDWISVIASEFKKEGE